MGAGTEEDISGGSGGSGALEWDWKEIGGWEGVGLATGAGLTGSECTVKEFCSLGH